MSFDISGNFTGGVTPVPIPNTEVKPTEVDGTIVTRLWESGTLPVYFKSPVIERLRGFYFLLKLMRHWARYDGRIGRIKDVSPKKPKSFACANSDRMICHA